MSIPRKKSFSQYDLPAALAAVGVQEFHPWSLIVSDKAPSRFFEEKMRRLEAFDTARSEGAKLLLVDAFLEEAIQPYVQLRIFKEATLRATTASGIVDYLVARRTAVPQAPLVCVAEAKKDNFDEGLAQCLVEMQAASENNTQAEHQIPVFGIVTNGMGWQLYRRDYDSSVRETSLYTASDAPRLLGALDYIFAECEKNLKL
jgi:hypothetical protein